VAIGIGCILVYFGYRLFAEVKTKEDSEGKFTLPSGAAIHLTRVGPGVFFSLFGTAIVIISFLNPVEYHRQEDGWMGGSRVDTGLTDYKGVTSEGGPDVSMNDLKILRNILKREFAVLDRLPDQLRADLGGEKRVEVKQAILQVKLAAIQLIWDKENWGNYKEFEDWVARTKAKEDPPAKFRDAAKYFKGGR